MVIGWCAANMSSMSSGEVRNEREVCFVSPWQLPVLVCPGAILDFGRSPPLPSLSSRLYEDRQLRRLSLAPWAVC